VQEQNAVAHAGKFKPSAGHSNDVGISGSLFLEDKGGEGWSSLRAVNKDTARSTPSLNQTAVLRANVVRRLLPQCLSFAFFM
jgi:hypothetical protein